MANLDVDRESAEVGAALGACTVKEAIEQELADEIAAASRLSLRTVRSKLKKSPGQRLVRNVFVDHWSEALRLQNLDHGTSGTVFSDQDCYSPVGTVYHRWYGAELVKHNSYVGYGREQDEVQNQGISMPAGCRVTGVRGVDFHGANWREEQPEGTGNTDHGHHGYTVTRDWTLPDNRLDVGVHWWHGGMARIEMRVVYDIEEPEGQDCFVQGSLVLAP